MKGIKIVAVTDSGAEALRKHLSEKLNFQQRIILKKFFKTSFDGDRTYVLCLKSAMLNGMVSVDDLAYSVIKSFVDDGYKKSDFIIEELE